MNDKIKVYYVHKATHIKFQLIDLKNQPYGEFHFKSYKDDKEYVYYARDIPLSDDFEIECIDNEFTLKELEQIENALYKYYYTTHCINDYLIKKVKNKIVKLLENNKSI